ncbi:MAG: hypothetical protein WCD12_17440 [Candidatus Binatus sp.]
MSERKRSDHAKRPVGQRQREKIAFYDSHFVVERLTGMIAESLSPHRVDLDGDYVNLAPRQRDSDRAETGAELDDELAGAKVRFGDDAISEFRTKEILTEAASSLVARCPPTGGHEWSPSWAWPYFTGAGGWQQGDKPFRQSRLTIKLMMGITRRHHQTPAHKREREGMQGFHLVESFIGDASLLEDNIRHIPRTDI